MKKIRISTIGCAEDYKNSILPIICSTLGYELNWVNPNNCDILVIGPFTNPNPKKLSWCPRKLRPAIRPLVRMLEGRRIQPLKIFHTAENIRHDIHKVDYSISFDLNIHSNKHFRFPYWMEMIDWTHEGVIGNQNPRYGQLLKISKLVQPLGKNFLSKNWGAAFLSSHIREPRRTIFEAVQKVMSVKGFGPHFDASIPNHHLSQFLKHTLLQDFAFNLCPENSMYPGYYTEKIPEAFYANCLPITWADENVKVDFNPNAFINLAPMTWSNYAPLKEIIQSKQILDGYAGESLLLNIPSILPFREFVKGILKDVY